jgi:hypothetical protein
MYHVQCTCFFRYPQLRLYFVKKQKYLKHINVFDYLHIIFLFVVEKNISSHLLFDIMSETFTSLAKYRQEKGVELRAFGSTYFYSIYCMD